MNIFWLLILAHLIADFPLQSDKVFALKLKYKWGLFPHIFIHFITSLLVALPYLKYRNFWIAIFCLVGAHFLLDWLKLIATKKIIRDSLLIFLLDQLLHVFFIWLACFRLFDIPSPEINNPFLINYYLNNKIIFVLAGFIFSVFGGDVLIYYLRKIFFHYADQKVIPSKIRKRVIGYAERFLATLGAILGGWFLILIPIVFIPRFVVHRKTENQDFLMINLITGLSISVGIGFLAHLLH